MSFKSMVIYIMPWMWKVFIYSEF